MTSAFEQTLDAIDALHAQDPRSTTLDDGTTMPQELAYAQRMSKWLESVFDAPGELLQLAVRAQHLQRWQVPREDYDKGRVGYLTWRRDQGKRAGETTAKLMEKAGYSVEEAKRVAAMIGKKGLGRDPEVQALEDCACLVFLENYFADFSRKVEHDHMVRIVQMTWRKMSPRAHELALTLPMSPSSTALVKEALGEA
ncbi:MULTISPECIES: DUF4202 domain-containing protein [Halomonadaceae]|jgi:hypothetical protein|uniref:DUF4202 domain-containing protein n=1 Tax=Vreelandella janggokensis TaxID=370767 RepID=A0ABT4IPD4_9GAMM|nr:MULTISPECIES: DUF4202 domain-containing protein [Halomonas]MCZ0925529.1 DUF4202 domain-containing protein [Halomonas janggokensis]MCZ0931524.1 DUF4202 domain-containing protein [Halomonas janggokensis]MDR5886960.1 DUF4202 domain-containing protein [Halomonas janggokensis]QPL47429.1 DUF4202 domain-containing protein [Halomonas sp. A40-4]